MANFLFLYYRTIPTVQAIYNSYNSDTAKKFNINSRFVKSNEVRSEDITWADVVFFIRSDDVYEVKLAKKAHEIGRFVVQFYDDDFLNLPVESIKRVKSLSWRKNAVVNGLSYADIVASPNELIGKKFSQYIKSNRYISLETGVEADELGENVNKYHTDDEKVRLVFAAGGNHEGAFIKYIAPAIPRLAEKYGDKISFVFFGVHPDLSEYENMVEVEYVPSMSLDEYRKTIKEGHYELGISPLETTDFTKCKYYNKFIEYTIAGFPGIYSNTEPFTLIVKDGENGLIADNNPESWYQAICHGVDNAQLRRSCYDNAYSILKDRMNPDAIFQKMFDEIPELRENRSAGINCGSLVPLKIYMRVLSIIENIYLVCRYLKETGIKGTVSKIKSVNEEAGAAKSETLS